MVTYPNAYFISLTSYVASSKYKMKCINIWISLFLSFCIGTRIWVFVLAAHFFFQFSVAHPLNAALLPRSPFRVFNLPGLFLLSSIFSFFVFQWKTKYKLSYNEIEITMHMPGKSIQKMWNRKHEKGRGCSATLIGIGSLITLDMTIKAHNVKNATYLMKLQCWTEIAPLVTISPLKTWNTDSTYDSPKVIGFLS